MSEKAQAMDPPTGGDEWMANPTWIKTAQKMVPEGMKPNAAKPSASLELEWVHGYRGFDCRNNLRYTDKDGSGNNIIFTAASLGVSQNIDNRGEGNCTQKFFGEHTDDVLCLAYSEATDLIATGEIGTHTYMCSRIHTYIHMLIYILIHTYRQEPRHSSIQIRRLVWKI